MRPEEISLRAVVIDETPYLAIPDLVTGLNGVADALDAEGSESTSVRMVIGSLLAIALQTLEQSTS